MVDHPYCILSITFQLGLIVLKLCDYWVLRAIIFHYVVLVAHYINASFFDAWHGALPLVFIYVRNLLSRLLQDITSLARFFRTCAKVHQVAHLSSFFNKGYEIIWHIFWEIHQRIAALLTTGTVLWKILFLRNRVVSVVRLKYFMTYIWILSIWLSSAILVVF